MATKPTAPTVLETVESSWVSNVTYFRGALVIMTREAEPIVYAGVPSWVFALFCAAVASGRSVGRLYHRIVRGRWQKVATGTLLAA